MKGYSLPKILLLIFIGCFYYNLSATHIVGGVMNYRYLGNDRYEISCYVYRDCVNGIPPLDDPAIIRIWDGVSEDYKYTSIPFDSIIDPGEPDACATIIDRVCVNWTKYVDTLILAPNDLGYTVYYQRCCRNNTIKNLTYDSRGNGVMDWGATYSINIPPPTFTGQTIPNSTPVFTNYPPVYICVGKPIVYDNSAIDADGDSLVYSLCTPYSGAFPDDPLNYYTEETPPFENVVWEPPYSVTNMLGGVPLSINAQTGLLTGTPNTLGQFVVGVCVDEYRNGELLTHTTRDFQFNIIDCNLQVVSSFFAPSIQCNNFTVNFQNQSTGATNYFWSFGDGDTSSLPNPTHTYRDTGKYTVTLVSVNAVNDSCLSRYTQVISIQYKKIDADFITNVGVCLSKNDLIKFIDKSTDSFNVASWKWTFSDGDTSNLRNPILLYNGIDTSITATLLVTSTNGCTSTITKRVQLFKKTPYIITPIITKCDNIATAQLSLEMTGNNIFYWTPSTGLNNQNIQNPTTSINNNITYYVTIKTPLSNGDTCVQNDSVKVKTINTVQINAADSLKICNDSVRLSVPLSVGQTVIWSTSNSFFPVIGRSANISIYQTINAQKYFVKIIADGCEAVDSIVVIYNDTIPQINVLKNILQCTNQVVLSAEINYSDAIIWSTSPTFNPIVSTTNTFSTTQIPKTVKYYIKANYKTCFSIDSIKVTVQDTLPIITLDDSINICGDYVNIAATVRKYTSIIWSTNLDFNNIISNSTGIFVQQNIPRQVYYIRAFYRDCFVTDSIIVNFNSNLPNLTLEDSTFFCSKNININAIVTNANKITWSINPTFTPILSNQSTFTTIQNNTAQKYYIKAAFDFCSTTDSILVRIPENASGIKLNDSIFVCKDSIRIQAQINNYDSLIWSLNNNFEDIISRDTNLVFSQSEPQKTYYIKVFNLGCESIDSIVVSYNDTLPNVILSSKKIFCSDSVFAIAEVDFFTSIEWSTNITFTEIISRNLNLQTTQPKGKRWYYCKVNYNFCSIIDSILLENNSINYSKVNIMICDKKPATINLNVQTPTQYNIIWHTLNDTILTNNSSSITFTPTQTQFVKFKINNILGCEIFDSVQIIVNTLPLIDATVDKAFIYLGEQVQLTATQQQGYSYSWTPIDEVSNNSIYNPTSSPLQNTLYTVKVTDRNNCKNEDSVSVSVENTSCDKNNIFIPNAFSPNGDGINDIFRVRSIPLKSYHLVVYNRLGNKVFESKDAAEAWDGNYNNQRAQVDVYGYYFEGECLNGEKIILKGNVTLLE